MEVFDVDHKEGDKALLDTEMHSTRAPKRHLQHVVARRNGAPSALVLVVHEAGLQTGALLDLHSVAILYELLSDAWHHRHSLLSGGFFQDAHSDRRKEALRKGMAVEAARREHGG
eukprot:TRINITY_DN41689_c0_g1_i4.p2 TRINITY_DN41689_c0_g1~~TRINITY_DN41689_c0_g1_i4.p2  ORF type:complete len:115 (-),score=11.06 TRINITY_DN41689_c0_g1_i4:173-517(-)